MNNPFTEIIEAHRDDWREDAACLTTDPEAFFPDEGDYPNVRRAKAICGTCDVRDKCLAWAQANEPIYGIWGGLTKTERKRHRRAAAIQEGGAS